jgi:O-antigen ligase
LKINKQITGIDSISTLLRCFIFSTFFLLSVRSVFVYLNYLTGIVQLSGIIAVLAAIAVCWWKIVWILYLFVAFIPLISGIQVLGFMKFAPLLSFAFSIIYIVWFLKRVFQNRKGFAPQNIISNLIDLLSGIVCLSIIVCLCNYPFDFSLYRLKYASIIGQEDPFWFMEAGYIMLQGQFLYRVFDLEINNKKDWGYFIPCLYCHAVTIIVFAFVQLIFNIPDQEGLGSIFSPFQSVHSFGGYVLILFFFFTYTVLKKKDYTKMKILLVFSLLICILISGSTSTLIWLLVIGGALSIIVFEKKKIIFIMISLVLAIIIGINLFPSFVPKGKGHSAIQRYVQRLNYSTALTKLDGRFSSWDQAFGIMKEFPCTGSGVGSFFKVSRYYHFSDKAHPNRHENAHNYYFQFGAELGIPALFLFFMILFFIYRTGLKLSDIFYVKGLLLGLSAYLLAMLTDHHLLLSTQQFLFWFVLFIISSSGNFNVVDSDVKKQNLTFQSKCLSTILFASCFLVVAGHAFNMFYSQKNVRGKYEYGLYKNYQIIDGNRVRWAMKQSCTEVLATTDDFAFSIYAEPEKLFSDTLEVKIFANDNLIDQMTWKKKGSIHKYYHISGIKGKYLKIRTSANDSFNPYEFGLRKNIRENRDQSVAITDITFFRIPIRKGIKECVLQKQEK